MSHGAGTTGVFTTDRALVVRSWDPWLAEATGIPEPDACGRLLTELFPELVERGLIERLRKVADTGQVQVLAPAFHSYLLACPPREASAHFSRMQQHVTAAPLAMEGGIIGVVVTIEDVTRRLDRERDLAAQLRTADDAGRLEAATELGAEPGTSRALLGALGDRSWRVRRVVAEGLARGSDESTVDALVAAVRERHRDPAVLNSAITAIARTTQDVAPRLITLLESDASDPDVRTYAALALGLLEDRRAVPALSRALEDDDPNVRYHAIEALGRVGSRETATVLAAVAETRDFTVAFAALDALALIGEPSVASRVVPLLDDPLLQPAAAEALGRLGGEDAIGPLASLLGRRNTAIASVAKALAALHARLDEEHGDGELVANLARAVLTPEAGGQLAAALEKANEEERHGIVVVLGWMQGHGPERALAKELSHLGVRRIATDILARRGDAAVDPLIEMLATDDPETRKAAASALGRIGARRAVPALLETLDDHAEVAVVAAGALGAIGDDRALDALLERLDHPQAAARQAIVSAIHSIGHPETLARVRPLITSSSASLREAAAKIIGYFETGDALADVLVLSADPDEAVRRTAVEQLARFEDPRAGAALVAALSSGTVGVRAAAARALGLGAGDDAIPPLLAACADPDPWVRYYAARALGHHRAPDTVRTLVTMAHADALPPVRIAAVEAIGAIGDGDGIDAIRPLVRDEDPLVARAALVALGGSSSRESLDALVAALDAPDLELAVAALTAIGRRADRRAVPAVASLATIGDAGLFPDAVRALARIGGEEAVAALVALAEEPRQVAVVVAALARLGADQMQWVARGLGHPDASVRCAVIEALGRTGHRTATSWIVRALEDGSAAVRLAAVQALGRLDLREAEATLGAVVRRDVDPAVRRAAERALAR